MVGVGIVAMVGWAPAGQAALPGPDPDLPLPLHQLGIGAMGLTLLDWPHLDRLLAMCAQLQRRQFLLTVAPLLIVGGTGSPVNPIATF